LVSAKEIIRRTNFTKDSDGGPWELVDEFDQHYFGINYLFDGHDIKFMLGYEMNELKDTEENGGHKISMVSEHASNFFSEGFKLNNYPANTKKFNH
jgi:hypothetical protein